MRRTLALAAAALACALGAPLPAAAQALTVLEACSFVNDVAITSAALAKQGVPQEKFEAALPDIYDFRSEKALDNARRTTSAGYDARASADPETFARALFDACMRHGADID